MKKKEPVVGWRHRPLEKGFVPSWLKGKRKLKGKVKMYTIEQLFADKHKVNYFHNCVGNVLGFPTPGRSADDLRVIFLTLSQGTRDVAHAHGLSDTPFRDAVHEELQARVENNASLVDRLSAEVEDKALRDSQRVRTGSKAGKSFRYATDLKFVMGAFRTGDVVAVRTTDRAGIVTYVGVGKVGVSSIDGEYTTYDDEDIRLVETSEQAIALHTEAMRRSLTPFGKVTVSLRDGSEVMMTRARVRAQTVRLSEGGIENFLIIVTAENGSFSFSSAQVEKYTEEVS